MEYTITKEQTVKETITVNLPSFRKSEVKYLPDIINIMAIIEKDGKQIYVSAYKQDSLVMLNSELVDRVIPRNITDFHNAQEISEEEFYSIYNSIKDSF